MSSEDDQKELEEEIEYLTMAEFLESTPPNQLVHISDLAYKKRYPAGGHQNNVLSTPEIQLHCSDEACNGTRFFRCINRDATTLRTSRQLLYLTYRCSNCQRTVKTFSIAAKIDEELLPSGETYKFGELPPYGPPTPSRLLKLIGPDRDIFLKGRRCENQGLGIGAFIYYRRVVENQKNRILREIVKVSEKLNASEQTLNTLKEAIAEDQFSKALDIAKEAIPESLLINGHSPVRLLHSALSEGVHAMSDEECLDLASSVRVVLGELSERLSQALKDEAELSKALSTLMRRNNG